jgi:hypothetical protein
MISSCCCGSLGFWCYVYLQVMPTFQRNMLSPSSGAEVTGQGSTVLIQGLKRKG